MAVKKLALTGVADGTTLTTSNGVGDALDFVGSGVVFATVGGLSCVNAPTSVTSGWNTSATKAWLAYEFFAPAAFAGDTFMAMIAQTGSVTGARVLSNSANHLRVGVSGTSSAWQDTANALHGAWHRVELYAEAGTSATDGVFHAAMYPGINDLTPLVDSGLITGVNIAGTTALLAKVLLYTASTFSVRHLQMKDGADAGWGATPFNAPPSVIMPSDVTATVGGAWSFTPTITSDDTVASTVWAVTKTTATGVTTVTSGLTGASGATLSGDASTTATAGSLLTATITVTDTGGLHTSGSVIVRVPVSGSTDAPVLGVAETTSVGSWTPTGAGSTGLALGDASDSTYNTSGGVSGTEQSYRHRLTPSAVRTTGSLTRRLATDTGTANATLRLYQGGTLLQVWTQPVTSTVTTYSFALSTGTVAAITDWGSLFVELGVTA